MFSRLTLTALVFGIVTGGSIAVAATVAQPAPEAVAAVKRVQFERVVISGTRLPAGQ